MTVFTPRVGQVCLGLAGRIAAGSTYTAGAVTVTEA